MYGILALTLLTATIGEVNARTQSDLPNPDYEFVAGRGRSINNVSIINNGAGGASVTQVNQRFGIGGRLRQQSITSVNAGPGGVGSSFIGVSNSRGFNSGFRSNFGYYGYGYGNRFFDPGYRGYYGGYGSGYYGGSYLSGLYSGMYAGAAYYAPPYVPPVTIQYVPVAIDPTTGLPVGSSIMPGPAGFNYSTATYSSIR